MLPIFHDFVNLQRTLRKYMISIICGFLGSGKSTQLPQILLNEGFYKDGPILVITLDAKRLAIQVSNQMEISLGRFISYFHSYDDYIDIQPKTLLYFVTPSHLLSTLVMKDPYLEKHGCVLVDDVESQNMDVDFFLSLLRGTIIPHRNSMEKPIRVVLSVSSGSLDFEKKLSHSFGKVLGKVSMMYLSQTTYPVKTVYRKSHDYNPINAIISAVLNLHLNANVHGDFLVFCPSKQSLFIVKQGIEKYFNEVESKDKKDFRIIILSLKNDVHEKNKMYREQYTQLDSYRRIILTTNVAESTIFVPFVLHVIDCGKQEINRFNVHLNCAMTEMVWITAEQARRRATCVAHLPNGCCYRLYNEYIYKTFQENKPSEILTCNWKKYILLLKFYQVNLNETDLFEFVPYQQLSYALEEMSIMDMIRRNSGELSELGRLCLFLNISPSLVKALLQSNVTRTGNKMISLVSLLQVLESMNLFEYSEQDHQAFLNRQLMTRDISGDHLSYLKLLNEFKKRIHRPNSSKLKMQRWCKENFVCFEFFEQVIKYEAFLRSLLRSFDIPIIDDDKKPVKLLLLNLLHGYFHQIAIRHDEYGWIQLRTHIPLKIGRTSVFPGNKDQKFILYHRISTEYDGQTISNSMEVCSAMTREELLQIPYFNEHNAMLAEIDTPSDPWNILPPPKPYHRSKLANP